MIVPSEVDVAWALSVGLDSRRRISLVFGVVVCGQAVSRRKGVQKLPDNKTDESRHTKARAFD